MRSQLDAIRQRKYIGVAELSGEVARILSEGGAPVQGRGTVSEVPDERTIRYYLTEGLLSAAEEKQGTASVFGYLHLLQLLVIKKLQSEHLPIRKIRELVQGRSERELERLLGGDGKPARNEALRYLETLLIKSSANSSPPAPAHAPPPPPLPSPPAHASPPTQPTGRSGTSPSPTGAFAPPSPTVWERVEIEPGLELHVHGEYQPPGEPPALRRLTQSIMRALEAHGRKRPGKRGK